MRTLAISKRIGKELLRDKRTMALVLLAPILIMWLMSVIFSANSETSATIGTVGVSSSITKKLDKIDNVTVKRYQTKSRAKKALKHYHLDAVIIKTGSNKYHLYYANIDYAKTALTKQGFQQALSKQQIAQIKSKITNLSKAINQINQTLPAGHKLQIKKSKSSSKAKITNTYEYGNKDTGFFNKIAPIFIGFFIFFFVFLISGIGLLNERSSGTLERVLATPVRRSEIVAGYMISYGVLAIIQTLIIVATSIWLLDIEIVGSLWLILLIAIVLSAVALSLGIFISTFASSEFQMVQFVPIVLMPQIFFSGIVPLDALPSWCTPLSQIMPLTYAARAMEDVTLKGAGFSEIAGNLGILLIFLAIFTVLNVIGLKQYRKV